MPVSIAGPKFYVFDSNGDPVEGALINTYEIDGITRKETFNGEDGAANANPVVTNAAGYADVYLDGVYAIVVTDADGGLIWSETPFTSGNELAKDWVNKRSATFASTTSFTISGNATAVYKVGRRVKLEDATTLYGTITATSYGASVTTVTVSIDDGSVLSASLDYAWVYFLERGDFVDQAANLSALRGISGDTGYNYVYVQSHTSRGDGGHGSFRWLSGAAAATYTDNNGTIIVPTGGDGSAAWLREFSSTVNVSWFGPEGDGSTDDRAAIQSAIDATPAGGMLLFSGQPHALTSKLLVTKAISIDFANSTLTLGNSSSPNNHHIDIYSTTDTATTWTESVAINQKTFTVTAPDLAAGDYVFLRLGINADPYDPNEEHFTRVCRVVSNSGTQVTLDIRVPYTITGTSHGIAKINSLVANCTFKNLVLDYAPGSVPDTHIFASRFFNVTFENIRAIKARIVLNPYDCHNLTVRNVEATVIKGGVSSHGRIFSGWQIENAILENLSVTCDDSEGPYLLFESWCRGVEVRNLHHRSTYNAGTNNSVHVAGGSYNIRFDGFTLENEAAQPVIDSGSDVSDYTVDNLRLVRYPKFLSLARVGSFLDVVNSLDFRIQRLVSQRLEVAMQASWSDHGKWLCAGVIKAIWVYVEDKTYLSQFYLMNSNGSGSNIVSQLTSGAWVKMSQNYGSDYTMNHPDYPRKKLVFYTSASMVANTKLVVVVEYWPIVSSSATFPISMSV